MEESYSKDQMIGLGIAFIVIPIIFVGLRVWAKTLCRKGLAWDDYLAFAALVSLIIQNYTVSQVTITLILSTRL